MITGRTDCGLQYALRRSSSSVAYCSLTIKCGTRDEAGFHSGLAHFLEHTLFKGTARKSAKVINSYLDRLGGELNAYTTKEEIVLHATVLKEDLRKAAGLLFELATSATFPAREVETEKGVVIDEINSYKDSPADDIYDRFEGMLFEGHPLEGAILGTAASVRKMDSQELRRFVGERFIPSKMAFAVVADEDEKKLERWTRRLVGKYFPDAQAPEAETAPQPWTRTLPPFDKTVNKRNHQANCVIGGTAPSLYGGPSRIAAILLANILGGPASNSILNSELREKRGLVYGVECSYTQYADTGMMAICLGCDRENLDKCIGIVTREITRLQNEPLPEARLKAARKQLLGQLAVSGDNGETQCLSMGKSMAAYGLIETREKTRRMIEAVSAEDLMESARTIFNPEKISRLIYL